jgi:copper homeostasis protein
MSNFIIEIATSDFTSSLAAYKGGADRIELCDNLAEGGTTQSKAVIKHCRQKLDIQLFPIIRPRGGDFLYTDGEFEIMYNDIELCKELNCDGVVIGLLKTDGSIDVERTSRLVNLAYPMEVTFHRAFDRCRDPFEALEQLIQIGCSRILTSGQKPTAPEGKRFDPTIGEGGRRSYHHHAWIGCKKREYRHVSAGHRGHRTSFISQKKSKQQNAIQASCIWRR